MKNNYYVLMNDRESQFQPIHLSGTLDIVKGSELPITGSTVSFRSDSYSIDSKEFFWNFNDFEQLEFDYREDHGNIVSGRFLKIIEGFVGAPHRTRKLITWMNGKKVEYDYYYVSFDRGNWLKGVQLNKELVFYDEDNSVFQRGRRSEIIPLGNIALTINAQKYDFFQMFDISFLSGYLLINEDIKNRIEKETMKGIEIIPLNSAFKHVCKKHRISVESLLPKVKKNLP